ncbi:TPA: tryptophan-rich sensory protein [Candidatus Poribacteria bacterium]|nr:tryptophan-rich sensory protein [Candidatus Poribacteria bacterium]
MKHIKAVDTVKLAISIGVCLAAGFIGSIFTNASIPTWYMTLEKPSFNPPNWLFGPVWTALYILMGIAAFLVWRAGLGEPKARTALIIFIIQLILNVLWSVAFFGFRSPIAGLVVIVILWVAILLTILSFVKVSIIAGILLIPYILWVSFASILNAAIYVLSL